MAEITDEMVEAAAQVIYNGQFAHGRDWWATATDLARTHTRKLAAAVLKAALNARPPEPNHYAGLR